MVSLLTLTCFSIHCTHHIDNQETCMKSDDYRSQVVAGKYIPRVNILLFFCPSIVRVRIVKPKFFETKI